MVTDQNGLQLSFFMTAGQVSDYTGATALLDNLEGSQNPLVLVLCVCFHLFCDD